MGRMAGRKTKAAATRLSLRMISRLFRLFGKGEADCGEARAAASDFLDGELDDGSASRIARHLGKCPLCAAFVRTLRATVETLRAIPPAPVPAGFAERVAARAAREGGGAPS